MKAGLEKNIGGINGTWICFGFSQIGFPHFTSIKRGRQKHGTYNGFKFQILCIKDIGEFGNLGKVG